MLKRAQTSTVLFDFVAKARVFVWISEGTRKEQIKGDTWWQIAFWLIELNAKPIKYARCQGLVPD